MIAKELEHRLISAVNERIKGAGVTYQVFGAWQGSSEICGIESPDATAVIYVGLGTMQRRTYSSPVGSFSGVISLTVRADIDLTGDALVRLASPIEKMLCDWQGLAHKGAFSILDYEDFSTGDISVNGGQVPTVDPANQTVTVSWSFTISGTER